jgi:hypothetical protein
MVDVTELWLPILVSAVLAFVASSVIHMLTPWHSGDYRKVTDEDGVMQALRPFGLPPGDYAMPRPSSMKEMGSPAFLEKATKGPRVIMTVLPGGPPTMTKQLVGWFVYLLVMTTLVGGLVALVVRRGADSHDVFHVALIVGSLGYAGALWQMTIWYSRSVATTLRSTIDGLIYAAITAAAFAYFWPGGGS